MAFAFSIKVVYTISTIMEKAVVQTQSSIQLSRYAKALLENLKKIKSKPVPDETSKISVSQTVSFFAILYEKVRNAVEYRETHLIRRAAIERILKRRLSLNPQGKGEAENLIRELLWARYFPNEGLGINDVNNVQTLLDKYIAIKNRLLVGQTNEKKVYFSQFLVDLLTCEIEEVLSPQAAQKNSLFTYFIYQVLKNKIKIEGVEDKQKNAYFYVALERAFAKNDIPYLRFHLFDLFHESISKLNENQLKEMPAQLPQIFNNIDSVINNPYTERLRRFIQKQMPPFYVLFELTKRSRGEIETILSDKTKLWAQVEQICRLKYAQTRSRLNALAIKAIIYIFLTKMIFALLLEYPLSLYFYDDVNYIALVINTLFPPFLMFIIVGLTGVPGEENTKRIFNRIENIIDADKSYETTVSFITRKAKVRRPVLIFGFTIFYAFTFIVTFSLLYRILTMLQFNLVSQAVFVFFVSIVTFFAYRIRQIAKEYQIREKESFFQPFVDFFFLPILSLGKFLSRGIARLNFIGVVLDFLIEAPFKLLFEVIEEWISFVRSKREEIV